MNETEAKRLANSQTLSQLSIGLIVAVAAFLSFALDKRDLSVLFWWLIGLGVAAQVVSMIFGGRGVAYISNPKGRFNSQAISCLIGFLFLASSLFALGPPLKDDVVSRLTTLSQNVGSIAAQLKNIDDKTKENSESLGRYSPVIHDLSSNLREVSNKVSKVQTELNDLKNVVTQSSDAQQPPADARSSRH